MICTMLIALVTGCSWAMSQPKTVVASYYHEGKYVSTGERYNNMGPTAAHRTLPFGSRVLVSHGGQEMVVIINDCGPAKWTGREIDLSLGVARRLGFYKKGVGNVGMQVLSRPDGARDRADCVFDRRPRHR